MNIGGVDGSGEVVVKIFSDLFVFEWRVISVSIGSSPLI